MKKTPRAWYRFENAAENPTIAELFIFGDIGVSYWGEETVSAKQFMDDLKALPSAVTEILVHVNSLGGDVFDGVAIANALRDQIRSKGRKVTTIVEGIAASTASVVIMAGETIRVADNALVMVHNCWTVGIGNAAEMRKLADDLEKIDAAILATYKWHSPLTDDELHALMDAETWMSADEAIARGFATEKVEGLKAAARMDTRVLAKLTIPAQYRDRVTALLAPTPSPSPAASAADILRLCREGDCLNLAEGLLAADATLADVQARVTEARTASTQAADRATQIRGLCGLAKLPELADGYIAGGITIEAIKAHLTVLKAKIDHVEIDGTLPVDQGPRPSHLLNPQAIYEARNRRTN
jgi:ATP-dependent protease ClpP protease subunit